MTVALHLGNCLDVMRTMADSSVDSIVTDPPYGLNFMGKKWDYDVPSTEIWAECLRVLKPGGHLLAFAGTRTQHRMAVRIEDAGFEIRDMIAWVYGSGFPKSLDVSKAIDKAAGHQRGTSADRRNGPSTNPSSKGDKFSGGLDRQAVAALDAGPETDAAQQWEGWGTALKPALEPITLARKPLIGTVAANVQAHGTGGLNIDRCRVASNEGVARIDHSPTGASGLFGGLNGGVAAGKHYEGRWPANLIHDGSDEVLAGFPSAPGQLGPISSSAPSEKTSNVYGRMSREGEASADSENGGDVGFKMRPGARRLDVGSAARFFYQAKASKADRNDGCEGIAKVAGGSLNMRSDAHAEANGNTSAPRSNNHPTVKPTHLMRYLCRLVTPPGGLVLDPFMGSGSTGRGAVAEGFRFVGIELDPAYVEIARARIRAMQPGLPLEAA